MSIFTGAATALITPFDESGINFDSFKKIIEFQIQSGIDALIVCGTTGEPSTMSDDEKKNAISFCVKQTSGRIPVIAGTGGNCTAESIQDSQRAQKLGADALLLVTPYYNKCTQDGLIAHFNAIADAVSIPIILYNVPSRTGVNILPDTVKTLSEHKNIVGLKEASGNIEQICEVARLCPDMDIYSGNDDHILPVLSVGGKGVISVLSNVAPQLTHDLVVNFLEGNVLESRRLQFTVNPLVKALFCEVNPIPVKAAMNLLGYSAGQPRLPLTPLTKENSNYLEQEMKNIGLLK